MSAWGHISGCEMVFSKWTRKSYAVFASLYKVTRIAQVSVDICLASLRKNASVLSWLCRDCGLAFDDEADKDEDVAPEWLLLEMLGLGVVELDVEHRLGSKEIYKSGPLSAWCG